MRPHRRLVPVLLLLALAVLPARPLAAQGSGPLSDCLLRSTTETDRAVLVGWIFGVISVHPQVKPIANVSEATRDDLNRKVAALLERLLTDSCREESAAAIRQGGSSAFQASFGILGQVAMQDLFGNAAVNAEIGRFAEYLDQDKLQEVFGTTTPL